MDDHAAPLDFHLSKSPYFRNAYAVADDAEHFRAFLMRLLPDVPQEDHLEVAAAAVDVWYLRKRGGWYTDSDGLQEGWTIQQTLNEFGLDPLRVVGLMRNGAPTTGAGFLQDVLDIPTY